MHVSTHHNDPDVQYTNSHAELSSGPHQHTQWDVSVCQESLLPGPNCSSACFGEIIKQKQDKGGNNTNIVNMTIICYRSSTIA